MGFKNTNKIKWARIIVAGLLGFFMTLGIIGYQWWSVLEDVGEERRKIEAADVQLQKRKDKASLEVQDAPTQSPEGNEAGPPQPDLISESESVEDLMKGEDSGEETAPTPEPITTSINETDFPLTLPDGFRISLFTPSTLGPIRFMAFSPDGILFVSLPSSQGLYKAKGGGKIFAFPDADNDGKADETMTVLSGLGNLPHGIAFYNNYLYIAEEDIVTRYPYLNNGNVGEREVVVEGLADAGEHVSRTIGFSSSGKMYISVGSSCNACVEQDERRAAISEYNPDGSGFRVFAEGIRNAVGFVFHPTTGEIWATENARDFLGDNLPPDEINIVREGKHYGWPYCYGKKIVDPKFSNAFFCSTTEASAHDIQAHSAPLGLRFIEGPQFPEDWQGYLLAAYHGSWNRSEPTGYKVVRLEVDGNSIVGEEDFISGWLTPSGSKLGRPVDVIFDADGALYISDDKVGVIYRVSKI